MKLKFLDNDYEVSEQWINLFAHFITLDSHKKMPTKQWYKELEELINVLGKEKFIESGLKWINDCIAKSRQNAQRYKRIGLPAANEAIQADVGGERETPEWVYKVYGEDKIGGNFFIPENWYTLSDGKNYFYYSLGGRILRGFIHSMLVVNDNRILELLDKFAATSPKDTKDIIYIYSQLDKEIAVPRLSFIKNKVKNKTVIKQVDKALKDIGKKSGHTKEELEETVIESHSLNEEGRLIQLIGDFSAVFAVENIKKWETYYLNKDGKKQKTLPKQLKENHPKEVAEFRRKCKEIKNALSTQKARIETFYNNDRPIAYNDWQKNYLNHPLVKILTKDLIWNFQTGKTNKNGIWNGNEMMEVEGTPIKGLSKKTEVRLWHPIGFEANYVLAWRNYLLDKERLQAFKQAFREVYILTDAEIRTRSYSNRFASHMLKSSQLYALIRQRGWSANMYDWDLAHKNIPNTDYSASYWLQYVYDENVEGLVSTDQVRFYRKGEQLNLDQVPALIFSEVMRDIDLFVGVTSIGNDPTWNDGGNDNTRRYWRAHSFGALGETAKTRAEILKRLVPKMKIGKVASFEGRYLKIQGKYRTYKIHMGSGNILMSPNDAYLCIVPDRSKKSKAQTKFIPFEGDGMLSIILSKALLLVDEDKITDRSILSQIESK